MSRSKKSLALAPFVVALALAAAAPALYAQGIDDSPAHPDPNAPTPTFTGKGKVTEAINGDTGAVFDIGGGVVMSFPRGLPVGRSRLVTLQKGAALPGNLVHAKWKPIGPALNFTGAFNTSGKPIVLSLSQKSDPVKAGLKLVLAVEVGTFCEGPNKSHKLEGGNLCSGFELHDAEYDSAGKRIVANLRSTGGLRMQFGLVPSD
jgi:hypothetical protein